MGTVTPIKEGMATLAQADLYRRIPELRWAYISSTGRTPRYLVVGGNYWLRLYAQVREAHPEIRRYDEVDIVHNMLVVRVKRDILEMGE